MIQSSKIEKMVKINEFGMDMNAKEHHISKNGTKSCHHLKERVGLG